MTRNAENEQAANGNGRTMNWIISVVGILVMISMAVSTYTVGRVDKIQDTLSCSVVQKSDYVNDYREIKAMMEKLDRKIDRLLYPQNR
jgi:hypothetical protein